jgi:gas vesicle protein
MDLFAFAIGAVVGGLVGAWGVLLAADWSQARQERKEREAEHSRIVRRYLH